MRIISFSRQPQAQRCIISLGMGRKGHTEPLARLEESLRRTGFEGDFLVWKDELPPGSPSQFEAPMAFKTLCFEEAKQKGYHQVLWIDSPCVALRSLSPIFEIISSDGYVMFKDPYQQSVGQWCGDDVLAHHQISRQMAMRMPEIPTSVIGLDLQSDIGRSFLDEWQAMAMDGITFRGTRHPIRSVEDHYAIGWNKNQCISSDPETKGHRYDQTAAGLIAHRLNMHPNCDALRDYLYKEKPVDRNTLILHHREFSDTIKSLDVIHRELFFQQPILRVPSRLLLNGARKLRALLGRCLRFTSQATP
jgi:hypothetical protein